MKLLMYYSEPRKDLKRFNVDDGDIANIAAFLFSTSDIPVGVKLSKPFNFCFCEVAFLTNNS